MSRADSQSICLLAACNAGMVTIMQRQVGSPDLIKHIEAVAAIVAPAIQGWPGDDRDNGRAYDWLKRWALEIDQADQQPPMRALVAMSYQSLTDLYERLKNKKKKGILEPIFPALQAVDDWFDAKGTAWNHYETADRIMVSMYRIIEF